MATVPTVLDLGRLVKKKYPGEYDDLPDEDLGRRTKAKYPEYADFADVKTAPAPSFGTVPLDEGAALIAQGKVAGAEALFPSSMGGLPPAVQPGVPLAAELGGEPAKNAGKNIPQNIPPKLGPAGPAPSKFPNAKLLGPADLGLEIAPNTGALVQPKAKAGKLQATVVSPTRLAELRPEMQAKLLEGVTADDLVDQGFDAVMNSGAARVAKDFLAGATAPLGVPGAKPPAHEFVSGLAGVSDRLGRAAGLPTLSRDFPQVQGAMESVANAIDFILTPAGVASVTAIGSGPAVTRALVGAGLSADMALQVKNQVEDFAAKPDPKKFGSLVVAAGLLALPTAAEFARNASRNVSGLKLSAEATSKIFDLRQRAVEQFRSLKEKTRGVVNAEVVPDQLPANVSEAGPGLRPEAPPIDISPERPAASGASPTPAAAPALDAPEATPAPGAPPSETRNGRDASSLPIDAYSRAVAVIRQEPAGAYASRSMLQRKLGVPFEEASKLVDRMVQDGVLEARGRFLKVQPFDAETVSNNAQDSAQNLPTATVENQGAAADTVENKDLAAAATVENPAPAVAESPANLPAEGVAEPSPTPGSSQGEAPLAAGDADNAPAAEEPVPTPGRTQVIPTDKILADPARFQYKAGMGQGGAGEDLRDVKKWDPESAGSLLVWKDPADGHTYVVNGHNRLALAERLKVPEMEVRYTAAKTAAEARVRGALMNIREGKGTPVDAAKLIRESAFTPQNLADAGVASKGAVARDGMALAKLDQSVFDRVVQGDIPVARAVAIAQTLDDHAEQKGLAEMLDREEAAGHHVTNESIPDLARFAKSSGVTESTTDTLFGPETTRRSNVLEKVEVSKYIRQRLAGEKRLFGAVGTEAKAKELGRAGNVIKPEENKAIAESASQAEEFYNRLATVSGPVSDVLDQAARDLAGGGNEAAIKETAYERIRAEVSQALGGPAKRSGGRSAPVGQRGADTGRNAKAPPQKEVESAPAAPAPAPAQRAPVTSQTAKAPTGDLFNPKDLRTDKLAGIDAATGDALTKEANAPGASAGSVEGSPLFDNQRSLGDIFSNVEGSASGAVSMPSRPKGEPRVKGNYSGLGAIQDVAVRNLSQLETARPAAHTAALRLAGSGGQTAILLRSAMPKIEAALKGGPAPAEFRAALIESRLRGIRERWVKMAEAAAASTDAELRDTFENQGLADLLENIEGARGIPQNPAETAAALLGQGRFDELRAFVSETLRDASGRVATVLSPEVYDAATAAPQFGKALSLYKELIEKPLATNHALNEGVFSDALGPLGTYYPLVPAALPETPGQLRPAPYRKPRNIANEFATGLAENYEIGMDALQRRLSRAIRGNNKAAFLDTLEQEGLLIRLRPKQIAGNVISIDGEDYEATRVEDALMPTWLAKETQPLLGPRDYRFRQENQGNIARVVNAVNGFALAGPLDLVFHSTNLMGTLVANTPFVGPSLLEKTIGNTPATKVFTTFVKIMATDPTGPEAIRELEEMAQIGLVPQKYAAETFSKRFAEQTGAHRPVIDIGPLKIPTNFGPLLYGPKGFDIRARIVAYRISKAVNPDASPQGHYHFVRQLGEYNREMQGTIERAMKDNQFSPFYTAASTMLRNGVNAWTGASPPPGGVKGSTRLAYKLATLLSGGAVGLLALWALSYKAYQDKWPWEDPRSKLLQIPLKDEDRNSDTGKALFGDRGGTAWVNLAFFSPLVTRGAGALGLTGAYDAGQVGASKGQMLEEAQRSSMNAFAHPFTSGPLPRAAFVGLTGRETFITSLRDDRGNFAPQFFPAIAKAPAGLPTAGARIFEAILSINGFARNLAASTGLGHQAKQDEGKGDAWLRMIAGLVAPRLIGQASDPSFRAAQFANQRSAEGKLPHTELLREIGKGLRENKDVRPMVRQGLEAGTLTVDDIRGLVNHRGDSSVVSNFRHLGIEAAMSAYRAASPAQQSELRPILLLKVRDNIANILKMPDDRLARLRAQIAETMGAQP